MFGSPDIILQAGGNQMAGHWNVYGKKKKKKKKKKIKIHHIPIYVPIHVSKGWSGGGGSGWSKKGWNGGGEYYGKINFDWKK